jgi:hypothetical protein
MSNGTRRSSRVPKEVAILLIGSDMEGRVFSEKTKTVVLSRHGAGIVSEYKLSAEQELFIRRVDTDVEAEVRVVGQLAADSGIYTYGVAFLDDTINFWGIDFPSATESEKLARRSVLECSSCKTRETVDQSDLESDVFAINKSIVRYCKGCGSSTLWKQPSSDPALAPTAQPDVVPKSLRSSPPPLEPAPPPPDSAEPAASPAPSAAPSAAIPSGRPENRRKHIRTKVNFKACVRYKDFPEDIVTCEDMSRGGLRFKSQKRYVEKSVIEVAAPYSPGMPSIFVFAQIMFVQELAAEKLFRYGVAYMR